MKYVLQVDIRLDDEFSETHIGDHGDVSWVLEYSSFMSLALLIKGASGIYYGIWALNEIAKFSIKCTGA